METSLAEGYCSIIGGYVYRGDAIPALRGAYLFADACQGEVQALVQEGGALVGDARLGLSASAISSFAEDTHGELYVVSLDGRVFRIDPA